MFLLSTIKPLLIEEVFGLIYAGHSSHLHEILSQTVIVIEKNIIIIIIINIIIIIIIIIIIT